MSAIFGSLIFRVAGIAGILGSVYLAFVLGYTKIELASARHVIVDHETKLKNRQDTIDMQARDLVTAMLNEGMLKTAIADLNDSVGKWQAEAERRRAEAEKARSRLEGAREAAEAARVQILNMRSSGIPVLDADLFILRAIQ